ncbi:ATP-dependent DNA helicase Snf21 [Coemansia interrupta]|uniref:ATP-dependent DNA helicase Snf21 n=1 Tax=Coemansia interrupta TaxID=1126814 RepID=A0A9W8LNH5_9FUNG|nr:ATP-dependent DNA helicase Snf21 [Coemansia interrupta]
MTPMAGGIEWTVALPLYAAGVSWTLVYDTIYGHQDKRDDIVAGVKSTSLLFGDNTKVILSGFSATTISLLSVAGYMNGQGLLFYATVLGAGTAHLIWQLKKVRIDNPSVSWRVFKPNAWFGGIIFIAILPDLLYTRYSPDSTSDDSTASSLLMSSAPAATPAVAGASDASPATAHAAIPGNVLTKDQTLRVAQAIQTMRNGGATEQNSEEYARLVHTMRSLASQQKQQQALHAQPPQINGNSFSRTEALSTSIQPQFTSEDIARLRKQIQAFRLVSKNMPLPPQLRQELWASSLTDEEKRLLDTPPVGLSTPAGNAVEAVHQAIHQQRLESTTPLSTMSAASAPGAENSSVHLVLPHLPQTVNFVSPHLLLREKLTAAGDQSARLQRLLVPSITPTGLDVRAMARERDQRREARIEYRIKELASLPASISDENLDVSLASGDAYNRPGLLNGTGSSARMKALIELKALSLRHKQRALRTEVVRSITRASQLGIAGDTSVLRRMKKQSIKEARLTEKMEREQRMDRERREQDQHKKQLFAITNHGATLLGWQKSHQQRMGKLGRSVLAFHEITKREEQKRKERIARERIQALKAGDEEAYLKLVDKEKDTRISHLLSQTDQYLNTLIEAVHRQQQSVNHHDASNAASGEGVQSWLADNAEIDTDEASAAQSRDYYSVAHRIIEPIPQQPNILVGGSLKEYQLRGLEWMVSLYNNRLNGILADEMGLGKTIQTISLITYLIEKKQQNGPFMIIVPLSTITNWLLEFEKWAPSVNVIGYKGAPLVRRALHNRIKRMGFQVLLTTYDYIIKDRPILSKINWIHMIIDEGHRMKNTQSKLAATLTTYYKTRYRLILTGTPLQNNLPELWALLNFVLPTVFSSAESFDEWFNAPFASTGAQDRIELNEEEQLLVIKRLHKVLRPFLLRRLKKDVEVDLLDKVEYVVRCSMSALQSRMYHQMLRYGTLFRTIDIDGTGRSGKASFNNTIVQLRKICNHPFVFEQVEARINPQGKNNNLLYRTAGKFELLDRVLSKLLATGHKVLVFFQMTQIMTIMQDFLDWRGISCLRLDGSTSDDDRREYMRIFNEPDSPYKVFLLSTRAGGQGLNLQTADTVVIFDSDWNPSADAQAMDRAHRIGQTNEVRILRLITRGSVEEDILARAEYKRDLDGKVIQAGKFDNKTSAEERERLLRALLKAEEAEVVAQGEEEETANPDDEINEMIARSEEERMIFEKMDKERQAQELAEWREAGNTEPLHERLLTESELPAEYLEDYDPAEERRMKEESARDKARVTRRVYYDDGLSEDQWLDALEDDNADLDEIIKKKRERAEKKRKRREEKLLQQHLKSQLGEGGADVGEDTADDDDEDDLNDASGSVNGEQGRGRGGSFRGAAASSGTPRKRGRPRMSNGGSASISETPGEDEAGDGDLDAATPQTAGRRVGRKRLRVAGIDGDDDAASGPATPTASSARKVRRKTGAGDMLPPEERRRLDEIFEAAFAAVEACVDPEYGHRRCDLFLELPSRRDYPDYYVIIRQPIAMKNIRRNVKGHKYANVADFHRDWKLMFNNARTYNEEGSMVYNDACQMQQTLEDKLNEHTGEDYHTPIGTQSPLPPAFTASLQTEPAQQFQGQHPPQQQQQKISGAPDGHSASVSGSVLVNGFGTHKNDTQTTLPPIQQPHVPVYSHSPDQPRSAYSDTFQEDPNQHHHAHRVDHDGDIDMNL